MENHKLIKFTRQRELYSKDVRYTKRIERILALVKYLNEFRSRKEIAAHLDIHIKSVSRYINLMMQLGFTIEQGHSKYLFYKITNVKEYFNIK